MGQGGRWTGGDSASTPAMQKGQAGKRDGWAGVEKTDMWTHGVGTWRRYLASTRFQPGLVLLWGEGAVGQHVMRGGFGRSQRRGYCAEQSHQQGDRALGQTALGTVGRMHWTARQCHGAGGVSRHSTWAGRRHQVVWLGLAASQRHSSNGRRRRASGAKLADEQKTEVQHAGGLVPCFPS